ncbi:sensor histidine kinase [Herbidospora mongoliensis]|uniref:sensor histidine kinase n=1 Tax=Herbidospora mongoliensis TaxID=688067 RepID=UPI00082B0094|nr:histidine kinase [Herbidospora mongoliensis]
MVAIPKRERRVWPPIAAAYVLLLLVLLSAGGDGPGVVVVPAVIAALTLATTAWALVRGRRQRAVYEARLTAWAGERAAQAERLRIARDLHDIVSHGLGLITVRATTARYVRDDPEAALEDIERIGRETTTELRRMLKVLRDNEAAAPLRPAERLGDLPDIVARAGLPVTLDVAELDEVSPGAQLAVCAVVREALNNTARHAGPTTATVKIRRDGDWIVVDVEDDGPVDGWVAHAGAGHGLEGLRERVAALTAGPAGNGFRVTARIPEAA